MGLVLTRKVGERIFIGNDIVIEVVETRGDRSKLYIEAPKEVVILRDELVEKGERK